MSPRESDIGAVAGENTAEVGCEIAAATGRNGEADLDARHIDTQGGRPAGLLPGAAATAHAAAGRGPAESAAAAAVEWVVPFGRWGAEVIEGLTPLFARVHARAAVTAASAEALASALEQMTPRPTNVEVSSILRFLFVKIEAAVWLGVDMDQVDVSAAFGAGVFATNHSGVLVYGKARAERQCRDGCIKPCSTAQFKVIKQRVAFRTTSVHAVFAGRWAPVAMRDVPVADPVRETARQRNKARAASARSRAIPAAPAAAAAAAASPPAAASPSPTRAARSPRSSRRSPHARYPKEDDYVLYVLQLSHGKWYVGLSTRGGAEYRFFLHCQGHGCAWTHTHPPIAMYEIIELTGRYRGLDEVYRTLELMVEHGPENVRGACFTANADLHNDELNIIERFTVSALDECYHCHGVDHIKADCPALAKGLPAVPRPRPVPRPRSAEQDRSDLAAANMIKRRGVGRGAPSDAPPGVLALPAPRAMSAAAPGVGAPRSSSAGRAPLPGASSDESSDGSDGGAFADGAVAGSSWVPAAASRALAAGRTQPRGSAGAPGTRAAIFPLAGGSTAAGADPEASRGGLAGRAPAPGASDVSDDGSDDGASSVAGPPKRRRTASPIEGKTTYDDKDHSFQFMVRGHTTRVEMYEGEKHVGYLSYSPSDYLNTVDVQHVHIFMNHQKKGNGRALFEYLIETEWDGMYVRVNNAAPAALPFYDKLGIKKRKTMGAANGESWYWPENCHGFPNMKANGSRKRPAVRN
jgi:hypothetical protein